MSRLLMVTSNHPFVHNGGETMFVGPEIEQLVGAGWQVRLAPLHAIGERLPLPAGVQLDLDLAASVRRARGDLLAATRWPGFAGEFARALRDGGVTGLARVWRWAALAQATWRWACALSNDGPTTTYTYWRGGTTLALARLAAQRRGWAAVTRVHGYELYEERFDPPFQPWPSVYAALDRSFTVSQHGLEYLRARGVSASRLSLARLGTVEAPAAARASDDGLLRVLSVSFVEPLKRVPLLARALSDLASRRGTPVEWTHFGDGPDLSRVRQILSSASPNLRAHLRGHVTHAQVLAHYAEEPVDVFVLVSASEGLPVSVQEALAAGVPVVATDVGGTREAVDEQVGQLLAADADAAVIADAIAAVPQTPALRGAAHSRWAERFDARRNHRAFAQQLQQVAAEAAGRAQ